MNGRQVHRVREDLRALRGLMAEGLEACGFQCRPCVVGFVWTYDGLLGLVQTHEGLTAWPAWQVTRCPGSAAIRAEPPRLFVWAARSPGAPFHPNVLPAAPYLLCYGRHQPIELLDGLARRVARILRLEPGAVMPDEHNCLHRQACQPVRRTAGGGGSAPPAGRGAA